MPKIDPGSNIQRRLAAIFCADVEGYTRLMGVDEAATLRLITACRGIMDHLIGHYGGRIANTAGDSVLAEFPSAVNALECALAVQDRLQGLNTEVSDERRVNFRIGLHVGEVLVRNGDLFGDGVNVAARLQGLAAPGSVCLSEVAHQFTSRTMHLTFEDLGLKSVKNVEDPIRAFQTRPLGIDRPELMPPVHRRVDAYLARRFHDLCHRALLEVTWTERLEVIEYATIASLEDAPEIDQAQLAKRLSIGYRKTGIILKRLELLGLAERTSVLDGQRKLAFHLTSNGLDIRRRLRPSILAALDNIMAPLSEKERETLRTLLIRIIQANDAKGSSDVVR